MNEFNYITEVISNQLCFHENRNEIIKDLIVWLATVQHSDIENILSEDDIDD